MGVIKKTTNFAPEFPSRLETVYHMKKIALLFFALLMAVGIQGESREKFVRVNGPDLIQPNGQKLFIQGTNLGNWLNPEGYMFGFGRTNSGWMIDLMLRQLVGPDEAAHFWQQFKDNYITRDDILFIRQQGANTIRLPFNYRLFTNEDFMGLADNTGEGFRRIDDAVRWCREAGLYLILDMHDCPGGQTGDNIDDSYGYPWIYESERSQQQFCNIWQQIAERYKDEPVILGYELMNEPIAHFFSNSEEMKTRLEPLYKRAVAAIRQADPNHIILLGGGNWNTQFYMFSDWTFDSNIMYTCHRYGGPATAEGIKDYIEFRDKTRLPMFMGEIGHGSHQWQSDYVRVMKDNNIGYTFWSYKMMFDGSSMMDIPRPQLWDSIVVKFAEGPRASFQEIRDARPSQEQSRQQLQQFLDNCCFSRCRPQAEYIRSMGMK